MKVECPGCGRGLNVPDEAAGKKGKCPGCGGVVPIPIPATISPVRVDAEDDPYGYDAEASEPIEEPLALPPLRSRTVTATVAPSPVANGCGRTTHAVRDEVQRVVVVDFDISFSSMVSLLIRGALASFVVGLMFAIIGGLIVGLVYALILSTAVKS